MRQPRDEEHARDREHNSRTRRELEESFSVCLVLALFVGLVGWLGSGWGLGWSLLSALTVFAFWMAFDSSLIAVRHALRTKEGKRQKAPLFVAGFFVWVVFTGVYVWLHVR